MEELWTLEEFFGKMANPFTNWQHPYPKMPEKQDDKCEECGRDSIPGTEACEKHTKTCKHCGNFIDDMGEKGIDGNEVYMDEDECKNCRKYCENCTDRIEDQEDYPSSNYCEGCRELCKNCDEPIEDQKDTDSIYCEDCRKHCKNCDDEIYDQDEYPDSEYDDDCRKYCKDCSEEIKDQDEEPDSNHCESCRKYCRECTEPIEDENYNDSEYCTDHRHVCYDCEK